ncbi:hypothetical protein [Marinifilum caeruleilacunae]|uniref:Lipoprotein n=1 Tax=Marinifilum caeruleilacunae TaxID=2499076 RepID=A0ABX1WTD5_9BACT|nr:hypothetical protein [Marinifilum caeruleilacunae]NOU59369.1 hypothetical protein [Marinifilum caeruleilacunae]
MKLRLIYAAMLLFLFASCATVSNTTSIATIKHQNNKNQISMQFQGKDDCCVEMKDCEGIWNHEKQSIYLTGLLVKSDCIGTAEEISIGIHGVDLKNIKFPHVICCDLNESGYVSWYNEAEVQRERKLCATTGSCEYQGDVKRDKIILKLTGFENNVLKGNFEGRIFLKGTAQLKFVKTSEYKDISKGTFRVNLSKEQEIKRSNYLVDNR